MGFGREHLENAQRRVSDGRDRIARQRRLVYNLPLPEQVAAPDTLLLETLEKTQLLLEETLMALQRGWENRKF